MKIEIRFFAILLIYSLFFYNGFSQSSTIKFDHLTINDGLSHNNILCTFQDSKGFIWFGTADGLNKYDGYSIKKYTTSFQDTNSISGSAIHAILEDENENLWLGSTGLDIFNKVTENISHFTHNPNNPKSISEGEVTCIFKDNAGTFWIGIEGGGLNKYNPTNNEFIKYIHNDNVKNSLSNDNVFAIFQDRFGVLWIGTGNGLNKFDYKNKTFIHYYKNLHKVFSIGGNRITSIFEDSDGDLWVGSNPGGLNKYIRENNNFIVFHNDINNKKSLSSDRINAIAEDANGNLLIGTNIGFNIFDKRKKVFTHYLSNTYDYYSINNNYITSIFKDNAGVIWLGTYNSGINKYESQRKEFIFYKHILENINSLSNNNITSISEDSNGNFWVGTRGGGLNMFNHSLDKVIHYTSNYNNPNSISFNTILSVKCTNLGNTWIGSNILDKFILSKNNEFPNYFIHYPEKFNDNNSIKGSVIWSIYEDSYNNLWVGSLKFLNKIEFINNKMVFTNYTNNPNDSNSLGNGNVKAIFEDSNKTLWIGADGLNKLVTNSQNVVQFIHYKHNPKNKNSLSNNEIACITEDKSGNLWIGTEGGGLNKFNTETKEFTSFGINEGLPNNFIWGILKDNQGNLWLSTNNGLSRFDPKNNSCKNFDISDGLPGKVFNQNAYYKSKSGKLFFGSTDGLVSFYPDSIKDNHFAPNVVLTDFKILNKHVSIANSKVVDAPLNKSISEADIIRLNYKDYLISFTFAALHYANPSKIDYAYKMEPIEKKWNYTDSKGRIATYTNLKPGKYVFYVKATNSDKIWNDEATSVKIIVAPPFWLTWWAYLIYGIIIIILLYALRNYIVMRERYKSELKLNQLEVTKTNEINQLKLRFFTNISHEFRTPLTLILGPLENLLSSKHRDPKLREDFKIMHKNASRLLRLVNQIMDFRKIESGQLKLQLTNADIISFITEVGDSFNNIAKLRKINYKINTNIKYQLAWFDPDKLEKIIYNLLSNAFKYTHDKGTIELSLSIIENYNPLMYSSSNNTGENLNQKKIVINIEDTGLGISEEDKAKIFDRFFNTKNKSITKEGTGIGLELTKELVSLHHGEINVESKEGKGSCFSVMLPLGKEDFNHEKVETITHIDTESQINTNLTRAQDVEEFELESKEIINNEEDFNTDSQVVLIVEDNKDVRKFIKDNLSKHFIVLEATNGQKGFDIAIETVPDIIISDIMMPVMDGLQMCEKIKTNIYTSHIPVILLTARVSDFHKIEGLETGADDYMTKPFNAKELALKVKNILKSSRKLREKFVNNSTLQISEIATNSSDEIFLKKATEIVESHISNINFDNKVFMSEIGMSRTQLYRKLKALTNQSVHEFIRTIRLNKSVQLLKENNLSISEITFEIGFNNHSYFNKCFKEQFGISPSEYIKQN